MRTVTKIYYGTVFKDLKSILSDGIIPYGTDGFVNWEESTVHPEMVYLSSAYPIHLGKINRIKRRKFVFFELDFNALKHENLYPDESYIFQSIKEEERIPIYEIRSLLTATISNYKAYYLNSLYYMGSICYRGIINPELIKRYCIINFSNRPHLSMSYEIPGISILDHNMNYKRYYQLLMWFFGDEELLPQVEEIKEIQFLFNKDVSTELEFWKKESTDRNGIEVKDFR